MLNRVEIQGRFTADPELRHTQSGIAVASFRLAVDRDFKDKDGGERKADFLNVIAWRQTGEFVSKYFSKGQMAVVSGKLQSGSYTDKDGKKHYTTDIVAENIYFCGSNSNTYTPKDVSAAEFKDLDEDDEELPF